MGGEPTFVSVDDMDGAEWNYTALSPKKRELAETLLRRLAPRFGANGFLHDGQGKWYPGEPLPRWAIGVHWRTDGKPLWHEPSLIADTRKAGKADSAASRCGTSSYAVITLAVSTPSCCASSVANRWPAAMSALPGVRVSAMREVSRHSGLQSVRQ